jgi:hypothetical protein
MTDTTTDTNADIAQIVDTYLAMWNEEDAATRAAHIEQAWTTDARYRDPLLEADGHAGLDEMVTTVHGHYPGQRFRRISGIDVHHDAARFGWELVAPDGTVTVAGIDFAQLAEDGRLRAITGFFGPLPEG